MNTKKEYNQAAINVLQNLHSRMTITRLGVGFPAWDKGHAHPHYHFTIRNSRGEYSGEFWGSRAELEAEMNRKNTAVYRTCEYDVLAALTKYDPGTFLDFCAEFGYDSDSISALKTYWAVCEEYAGLARIFTREELERLAEIQ